MKITILEIVSMILVIRHHYTPEGLLQEPKDINKSCLVGLTKLLWIFLYLISKIQYYVQVFTHERKDERQ